MTDERVALDTEVADALWALRERANAWAAASDPGEDPLAADYGWARRIQVRRDIMKVFYEMEWEIREDYRKRCLAIDIAQTGSDVPYGWSSLHFPHPKP